MDLSEQFGHPPPDNQANSKIAALRETSAGRPIASQSTVPAGTIRSRLGLPAGTSESRSNSVHPLSRSILARVLLSAMLVLLPAVGAGLLMATAHAQPPPPDQPSLTLPWQELGLSSEIFLDPDHPSSFTMPVPTGLTAVRLSGTIAAPLNIDAGTLVITGNGNLLAAIDLPPGATSRPATPLDVDLSAAGGGGSSVDLTFDIRPRFDPQYCGPRRQLVLNNLATVFTGIEVAPTTIANFFPTVLQRATIFTPTDADADEQQAVLLLVSTLARLYQNQPMVISVVNQPRGATPPPADQLARTILVEKGGTAGLKVENRDTPEVFLRVSGSGGELSTQVSLLANQLQALAQVDTVRVEQAESPAAAPSGDTMTFRQLNIEGQTDVIWTSSLSVGVDRASLGSDRVDGVQVHLLADYTPVARDDAASVVIRSGGVVVYRAALDNTGLLDATFDLDSEKIGQFVDLDIALTYTPRETCGALIAPLTFQVDPRSTLTVHRGGPPLHGFGAAPSEFSPSFMVAMDGTGPNQLAYVARLVASMARSSSKPLSPQVVDLNTAAAASTGALIVANAEALKETALDPPISGDGTTVEVGVPTEVRVDIAGGLGSIQAFADQPRNRSVILVTTTAAWTLVDPLFSYLGGLNDDLSALKGDVLFAGAAGEPTNLAIRTTGDASDTAESPQSLSRSIAIGAAVAVVAVIAMAAAVLWSRRRRTSRGSAD
ncbi:hypothetical protein [Mycolicibacterium celeriflavum]|uniref:hypothetical protein n=1 Tax=Mycolicibacterium celeriflavum TaxID=1249101 RepID=UPI001FD56EDC|nr:hypothetical protein [Mycolicibacterium celeriflavum]